MTIDDVIKRINPSELRFQASRSGGPGGQNVNKVSTRVELRFNVTSTNSFSEEEKSRLQIRLSSRINNRGELVLVSSSERTQFANKKKVLARFYKLISDALRIRTPRIKGTPTRASVERRIEGKKRRGVVKKLRKTGNTED